MALAYPQIKFLYELRRMGALEGPYRVMEFGEQNWYCDLPVETINESAQAFLPPEEAASIIAQVNALSPDIHSTDPTTEQTAIYRAAELYYRTLFGITSYIAVDLHGSILNRSVKHDLNFPLPIAEKHDLVINFGTGEHVFNQYSYFKNMHDMCDTGGLMLHSMPNQGCYDHGFFNYHPTFIFDLAHANGYELVSVLYANLAQKPAHLMTITREGYVQLAVSGNLSPYSALLCCLRKKSNAEFVIPQQGFYNDHLPADLRTAWQQLDR